MFSATFQDYDAYTDAIERVDARFMLQNLEQRQWHINGLVLPSGITIQHCWSGSGALAQGTAQGGGIELAIPAIGHFVANGKEVPQDGALLISKGREFMVSIRGIHRWFNLFLPDPEARATGIAVNSDSRQRNDSGVLGNRFAKGKLVSQLLLDFLSNTLESPEIAASKASLLGFQAELLTTLETAYGTQPSANRQCRGRPSIVDKNTILLAVDVIEASANPTVSPSNLAEIAQVSERSLRAGFHKYLGLSPTRYMQLRTLHRARQRLSASSPGETTVARVAADLGIWDLGRFAMRYRRLFGEPPSATLQGP